MKNYNNFNESILNELDKLFLKIENRFDEIFGTQIGCGFLTYCVSNYNIFINYVSESIELYHKNEDKKILVIQIKAEDINDIEKDVVEKIKKEIKITDFNL